MRLGPVSFGIAFALAGSAGLAPAHATTPEESRALIRAASVTSPSGNYLAGRVAADLRDLEPATVYLRAALRSDPKNTSLLDRAFRVVLANGDGDDALVLAEQLAAADPGNRLAKLALAMKAVKARQFAHARSQLNTTMRGSMPDLVATLIAAWTWQGSGDTKRALEAVDRLGGSDLAEILRDLHAGLIADVAGQSREAERRFARAYKASSTSFVIVDAYGRRLARSGKREEALKIYRGLAALGGRNARLTATIQRLEKGGSLEPPVRNAREGIAETLFGLGQIASRGDTSEIALIYLQLALILEPEHELALMELGDLFGFLHQPHRAIEVYERVPESSSFRDDVEIRVAANLAQSGKAEEAIGRIEALLKRAPTDTDALVALGNIRHSRKEYGAAADAFARAIALVGEPQPQHWRLFYARALSYDGAKDWPKAEADLKVARRLAPDQAVVLNYLGYSWVDRGLQLDEALAMIQKAVDLRPNDGDIIDSLGWAFYRLGRLPEAVAELEKAIELRPSSWEINDHLGDVYWRVGRRLEAKFQWLHALSLDIDDDKRALTERKLSGQFDEVEAEIVAKRAIDHAGSGEMPKRAPNADRTHAPRAEDRAQAPRATGAAVR